MSTSKSKKPTKKKDEGIIDNIIGLVKKSVLAGLGMAFLGEEKIEDWATKIAKENKLTPKDMRNFINDVRRQSVQARKDVEKRLREMLKDVTSSEEKSNEGAKKAKSKSKSKKKKSISSSQKAKVTEATETK